MNEKLKKTLLLALFAMIIIQVSSFAHSGRTDKYGGHKDNQNKSGLGSYHYHCGGYPAHLHTNGVCPYSGSSNSSSSSSGEVQAISEGEVTITAKSNNSKQDSLNLVIKRKPILVEKISINNSVSTMNVGDELNLDIICIPENADNKELIVNSSNTDVINV